MGDKESKKTEMTKEAASRIQSTQGGGNTEKGSFAARAQAAADKNENAKKN
jgi:hypothetical protein